MISERGFNLCGNYHYCCTKNNFNMFENVGKRFGERKMMGIAFALSGAAYILLYPMGPGHIPRVQWTPLQNVTINVRYITSLSFFSLPLSLPPSLSLSPPSLSLPLSPPLSLSLFEVVDLIYCFVDLIRV